MYVHVYIYIYMFILYIYILYIFFISTPSCWNSEAMFLAAGLARAATLRQQLQCSQAQLPFLVIPWAIATSLTMFVPCFVMLFQLTCQKICIFCRGVLKLSDFDVSHKGTYLPNFGISGVMSC